MSRKIGQYEIKRELGQGGMGTVYLGLDPRLEREVAIKVLKPNLYMEDPTFSARFEQEAKTVASLTHNAIVPIYDYNDDGEWRYFVMPYMSGGSLRDRLEKGVIPLKKALLILYRVAAGLDKAHSNNIVHRDLKPGNILFDEDDEAYLCDFGIMKLADPTGARTVQMTQTGLALGTPHYMSPEQLDGAGDLDGRSDIYALGIILYEMLAGKKPYDHESMARVIAMHYSYPIPNILEDNPKLPPDITNVIQKALAKKRDDRFGSAQMLYKSVEQAAAEQEPKQAPAKRLTTAPKPTSDDTSNLVQLETNKSKSQELNALLAEARRSMAQHHWDQAERVLDKLLKIDPSDGKVKDLKESIRLARTTSPEEKYVIEKPPVPATRKLTIKMAIGWLVVSVIGNVLGVIPIIDSDPGILTFGVLGMVSGLVDWFFLRRYVRRSGYWLPFKIISYAIILSLFPYSIIPFLFLAFLFFIIGYVWLNRFPKTEE